MQGEIVGGRIDFLEFCHADTLLFCHRQGYEGIVRDDLHGKAAGTAGDLHADFSQADDAKGLAAQFGALQGFLFPLAGMHQGVGAAEVASHGQHDPQGLLGHRDRVGAGRVHDRDALASGGFDLNVVDADSRASDHSQFVGMFEQSRVDLHRRANNECVSGFQLGGEFAVQLIRGDDCPVRLFEQLHCRGRDFFRNHNFHGEFSNPFFSAS